MKYIVRTIENNKEREQCVNKIKSQISDIEVYIDYKHDCYKAFLDNIKRLYECNGGVLIEDDVILCKDFINKAESIINKYPNYCINFFDKPFIRCESDFEEGINFLYTLCVYFPKDICKGIIEYYDKWIARLSEKMYKQHNIDVLIAYYLMENDLQFYAPKPHLVQHEKFESTIDKRRSINRQSKYFIDDIN